MLLKKGDRLAAIASLAPLAAGTRLTLRFALAPFFSLTLLAGARFGASVAVARAGVAGASCVAGSGGGSGGLLTGASHFGFELRLLRGIRVVCVIVIERVCARGCEDRDGRSDNGGGGYIG